MAAIAPPFGDLPLFSQASFRLTTLHYPLQPSASSSANRTDPNRRGRGISPSNPDQFFPLQLTTPGQPLLRFAHIMRHQQYGKAVLLPKYTIKSCISSRVKASSAPSGSQATINPVDESTLLPAPLAVSPARKCGRPFPGAILQSYRSHARRAASRHWPLRPNPTLSIPISTAADAHPETSFACLPEFSQRCGAR